MLIGKRINGRYKLVEMIGGGGMAQVYLAQDMILEREVAIKILRMDFSNDEEFIKRFNREAQSATSLAHPNIVSIYDVGEENDIYFIVMEYVKGLTLKQYIQRHYNIPVETALHFMEQITAAIEHAHQHDIIHRDIKPQNILIDNNNNVKITDFGIATALSATSITQTNAVLGSVHYLSPEQARGGMANKKSDIYSLGIVMFELLTGRLPFSGESAVSIALKHLQSTTPSPKRWNPLIPQSVENIVLKATAKDPFHRYDSVGEMIEDIKTALDPDRIGEKPFFIPEDVDATIAMPIIKRDSDIESVEDTLILNGNTQEYTENEKIEKKPTKEKVKKAKKSSSKQKKNEKKPKGKLIKVLLITLITIGILGVLSLTVLPKLLEPSDVKVPDVEGEAVEEAIELLLQNGFVIGKETEVENDVIEVGKVISTNPKIGRTVKKGTTIDLTISKGPKSIEFSDYKDRNVDDVQQLLEQLDFMDIEIEEVYNNEMSSGMVISQSPVAGSQVIPSQTVVKLTVSKGPEQIVLKDLQGYNEKALSDYGTDTGLVIKTEEQYSDTVAQGLVISQSPKANSKVDKGSTVNVIISKGKEQLPRTETIPITILYEPDIPGSPQRVEIYIEDMTRSMTSPDDVFNITKTETRNIELVIEPGGKAGYKIMRDNEVFSDGVIPY